MKIGDRVRFKPLNDTGVIVGREKRYFNRPWMVRWDASGVVTSPIGKSIEPALPETVNERQS